MRPKQRIRRVSLWSAVALLLGTSCLTQAAKPREAAPVPLATIPVDPLGYRPPGQLYLLARYSSATLDFLDATHLLFTFRVARLLRRQEHGAAPNATPDSSLDSNQDQMIHAVVLELPSGNVTASADWRLHDRRQYLWPLGNGRVLLRRGNELLVTDKTLALHPFLHSVAPLREVYVSPGGRMLVTESDLERHTPEEHERLKAQAELLGDDGPAEDAQISMIEPAQKALKLNARAPAPGKLVADSQGFLNRVEPKPNQWTINFHPFEKPEPNGGDLVDQVNSTCAPDDYLLNDTTVLIMTCSPRTADRLAQVVSLDGKELWKGSWRANLVWPTIETAANGADFAIGWIGVSHPVDTYDPLTDSDVHTEVVDVIDTHNGAFRFSVAIQPVLSAGQNFALSPDGDRLAVLNRGAIELYPITPPPPSPK